MGADPETASQRWNARLAYMGQVKWTSTMSIDSAGNSYVMGGFRFALDFPGVQLIEFFPGVGDLFVAKYDRNGTFVWAIQAGPDFIPGVARGGAGRGISVDNAGNSYVTGQFETGLAETAFFVAKYDTAGARLWVKHARNDGVIPSYATGAAVSVDGDGNSYVTGDFSGSVTFGPGEANQTTLTSPTAFKGDLFVGKYDGSGTLLWAMRIGGTGLDQALAIAADPVGNLHVTGTFSESVSFGLGETNETTLTAVFYDMFVAKYDTDGGLQWATHAPGPGIGEGSAIAVDGSGDVHVSGRFVAFVTFGPVEINQTTLTVEPFGSTNVFIAKYNRDGTLLWARQSTDSGDGRGVSVDGAGNSYVTGLFGFGTEVSGRPASITFGRGEVNETTLTTPFATEIFLAKYRNGGGNIPPIALPQELETPEDTALGITLTATDRDGDRLTYSIVTEPAHGVLSGDPPVLTYTPHANYHGPDEFTFRAFDGFAFSNDATVTIKVISVNDGPVALPQELTTPEDTALDIILTGHDVDGDNLVFIPTEPSHGVLSGTSPNFTYTPHQDYVGPDRFTFTAFDGTLPSASATVDITVGPINVTCGSLTSGSITAAGEADFYSFAGEMGQTISLALASTGGFSSNPYASNGVTLSLFAPSGGRVGTLHSNSRANFVLPEAGTYVIRVSATNLATTGSYNLSLECLFPAPILDVGVSN